jgi:voltage-gated potassium channel
MTAGTLRRSKAWLRQLYEGGSPAAHRFRYALLAFDLVTLLFIVATSFRRAARKSRYSTS